MSAELVTKLKGLKLHGMAQCWPEVVAKARHSDLDPEQWMTELITAETAEREVCSTAYQMTAARFPAHRDLTGFDFSQSRADETLIRRLHGGEFMEASHNVVFIGGPGTGKTHLATAIGIEAIQRHGRRVKKTCLGYGADQSDQLDIPVSRSSAKHATCRFDGDSQQRC